MDLVDFLATECSDHGESPAGLANSLHGDSPPLLNYEGHVEEPEIVPLSSDCLFSTANALEQTLKRLRQGILESQNCVRDTLADVFEFQAKLARETAYHVQVVGLMADAVQQVADHHVSTEVVRFSLKRQRDGYNGSQDIVPDGFCIEGSPYKFIERPLKKRRLLWRDDSDGTSPQVGVKSVDESLWRNALFGTTYPSDQDSHNTDSSYLLSSVPGQDLTGDDLLEYSDDASDSTMQEHASPLTPSEKKLPIPERLLLRRKKRSQRRNIPFLQFPVHPMDEAVEHGSLSDSGLSTDNSESDHRDMTTLLRAWPPAWPESLGHYRGNPKYGTVGDDSCTYIPGYRDQRARKITFFKEGRREKFRRMIELDENGKQIHSDPDWLVCDVDARIENMFWSDRYVYTFDDQECKYF